MVAVMDSHRPVDMDSLLLEAMDSLPREAMDNQDMVSLLQEHLGAILVNSPLEAILDSNHLEDILDNSLQDTHQLQAIRMLVWDK